MLEKVFFKLLAVITGLLLQFNVWGQTALTLHVATAGTLPSMINSTQKWEITDLTLTGDLNGTDILFIREMAGRDVSGGVTNGKLAVLDLAGANIVQGGNYYYTNYYGHCYTFNNAVSDYMFSQCTRLTSVIIGNSVTWIGEYAFSGCTGLTSVTIGNSVTSIRYRAFSGCTGLTSVTIPNSVTSIGDYAFQGCTGLTSVTIGNSVTSIGEWAFYGCTKLASVTIGNSLTSIASGFDFNNYPKLTEIIVSEQNPSYSTENGVLFNKNKTTLIQFPRGKSGSYTIPNSVTSIETQAFYGCTGLTNVTIGNSVTSIGARAFEGCTGLTSITIPNSVTSIESFAFSYCTGLTSITIGNGVTSIESSAFYDCTGLKEIIVSAQNQNYSTQDGVLFDKNKTTIIWFPKGKSGSYTIPNSVTSIGNSDFAYCTGLTSVTIPNSVTSIGGGAFSYCTGLTSVTIPNSVTSIGQFAFRDCTGLTSITIPNSITSIKAYTFDGCGLTSVSIPNSVISIEDYAFYNCGKLTNVTFGNSVTSIGNYAFYGCTGLTSITIPNRISYIGDGAFYGCSGLAEIHNQNPTPLNITSTCFSGVNKTTSILYVPRGSRTAYLDATGWKDFRNIVEEDATAIQTIHTDTISVLSIPNGITVETKLQTPVSVYTLSGRTVYQSLVNGKVEIRLDKGVYIVRVNNGSEKVIVK